jgi:hypothetical protein
MNNPFVFLHGIKIHCTFLKCSDCRKHRNAPTFNLRSAPPSIGTSQYWTDEVKKNDSNICTKQQRCVPVPDFPCQQIPKLVVLQYQSP